MKRKEGNFFLILRDYLVVRYYFNSITLIFVSLHILEHSGIHK